MIYLSAAAITVESIEVLRVEIDTAGEFDGDDGDRFVESDEFIGIDPRDDGCEGRRCIGMLTRVRRRPVLPCLGTGSSNAPIESRLHISPAHVIRMWA